MDYLLRPKRVMNNTMVSLRINEAARDKLEWLGMKKHLCLSTYIRAVLLSHLEELEDGEEVIAE